MASLLKPIHELDEATCPICGKKVLRNELSIAESNMKFLQECSAEGTLDEAFTILRIMCEKVPGITLEVSDKSALDLYFKKIQEEISRVVISPTATLVSNANQVMGRLGELIEKAPLGIRNEFLEIKRELDGKLESLEKNSTETPLTIFNQMFNPLTEELGRLIEKLPKDISEEFAQVKTDLQEKLVEIKSNAEKSNNAVGSQVRELRDSINSLINKPSVFGRVKESTLVESWGVQFSQDLVDQKGGPGEPDALVVPYLGMNGGEYGRKISLERKAGVQKYLGKHVEEVCRHARKYGASQAMLIYDSKANLPSEFPPIKMLFRPQQKLTIAVACLEEGSWVTAREILEVLQIASPIDDKPEKSIDLAELDKAIADIQAVNAIIDKLRKTNNATLKNSEGMRGYIEQLEESVLAFQARLRKVLENKTAKGVTD